VRGTPGFVGERLREAREGRGLTAVSLADLLGVTRQAISLYESGESSPQPDVMEQIANKLNLPIAFFLRPTNTINRSAIFFRSQAAATKLDRGRGNSRIEWLSTIIVPYLRQFVSFPKTNLPTLTIPDNPLILSDDDIEEIAIDVRRKWGLGDGPISNMVLLIENNGFIVTRMDLGAPTLDAFSTFVSDDGTPYVVLGADKQSAVRSRFDTAHETAHFMLHRNFKPDRLKNALDFKGTEQQANRFASAFLVPRSKFADDFSMPTLDAFLTLKNKWLVSVGMLIKRAFDLGFISEEHYRRLWINYNRRGWRREEPLDNKLPVEQPVLLRRACRLVVESKVRTPEQILMEIPLAPKDIEELMYLPNGYLAPSLPQVELRGDYQTGNYKSAFEEVDRILKGF
jgi:Zn-dependent peptidase ImmA (M78 family)/transcriptional regulator with XRE-family HTH domain